MRYGLLSLVMFVAIPAHAAETKVTAANAVEVTINSDDFSERYEYVAPDIPIKEGGVSGSFFVAAVKKGKTPAIDAYQGFVIYSGDWRFYNSAVFRGGDVAKYTRTTGEVVSCRYGCTLSEKFTIDLSPAEIVKYANDGIIQVQVRAQNTQTFMISIPVSYIEAVNEVKKR